MTDGVALNGRPLREVAADHAALFSGIPSAYDGINEFNNMMKDAMSQHLKGDAEAVDTFKAALKQRSMLLRAPEILKNNDARGYLQGIVVTDDNPEVALQKTVTMHGYVDDPTYKGEPVVAQPEKAVEESKPIL